MFKCYDLIKNLSGKPPRGTCAPFNQLSATQVDILEELGIEYDNSLSAHDCLPYWYRDGDSWTKVDYNKPAEEWLKPFKYGDKMRNVVEIPCSWYMEDMMPMQFLQNVSNAVSYPIGAKEEPMLIHGRMVGLIHGPWNISGRRDLSISMRITMSLFSR
jgi:hypothetical protein